MKKLFTIILSVCILLEVLVGCGKDVTVRTTEPATTDTAATAEAPAVTGDSTTEETPSDIKVVDMSGDEVIIPLPVEKIVNLWPAGTSSFFVMGAGERLAALAVNNAGTMNSWTKFFYPDCSNIPAMGGISPSVEEIMSMDPDLVIVHPQTVRDGLAQQIRDVGVPAININFSNYEQMTEAYTILGGILGGEFEEKLNSWCEQVASRSAEISDMTSDIPEAERPVVLYISGQSESPTTTMSSGSICEEWTDIAGGIYATTAAGMPEATELTAEEIFQLDPDVIIVGGTYQHKLVEYIQTTDGWKDLKAVQNDRLYTNPYGCFNWDRFGLESLLQLDYAFMCIQPELAEANGVTRESMIKEVIEFYETMNGAKLTEEQAGFMLDGLNYEGVEEEPSAGGQGSGQNPG